jgi:hypothetical protein
MRPIPAVADLADAVSALSRTLALTGMAAHAQIVTEQFGVTEAMPPETSTVAGKSTSRRRTATAAAIDFAAWLWRTGRAHVGAGGTPLGVDVEERTCK